MLSLRRLPKAERRPRAEFLRGGRGAYSGILSTGESRKTRKRLDQGGYKKHPPPSLWARLGPGWRCRELDGPDLGGWDCQLLARCAISRRGGTPRFVRCDPPR